MMGAIKATKAMTMMMPKQSMASLLRLRRAIASLKKETLGLVSTCWALSSSVAGANKSGVC